MLRSRTLRTAVNLCLTASLLTPVQAGAIAFGQACDQTAGARVACAGCDHCRIDAQKEFCGCCQTRRPAAPSHCGDDARRAHSPATHKQLAAAARREREPVPSSPETERPGACLCAAPKSPAAPAAPAPSVERVLRELASAVCVTTLPTPRRDRAGLDHAADPPGFYLSTPRDSQRRLCVWRI
ncbi:hypothetical protein [Botrimarina sp.]|uniref:hypothetical protein n=1 Tax=Botrimarina sp. TaxID=2795802 RepID=UPI0032EE2383